MTAFRLSGRRVTTCVKVYQPPPSLYKRRGRDARKGDLLLLNERGAEYMKEKGPF